MWTPGWIIKWISELPTAAAQKEKFETQIMLLKADHKNEVAGLQETIAKLKAENRELRAKIEPMTEAAKQAHAAVSTLQDQLRREKEKR